MRKRVAQRSNNKDKDAVQEAKKSRGSGGASFAAAAALEPSSSNGNTIPGPADVLLGRGKGSYEWQGNVTYQHIIRCSLPLYAAAKKKQDKTKISNGIVAHIKASGGRFLKEKTLGGKLCEVTDKEARIKVAQALRHRRRELDKAQSSMEASPFGFFSGLVGSSADIFSQHRGEVITSTRTDETEPITSYRTNRMDDDFGLEQEGGEEEQQQQLADRTIPSSEVERMYTEELGSASDISSEFSLLDLNDVTQSSI